MIAEQSGRSGTRKWQKWQLRSSFNLIQFWIFFNGRCLAELEEELPEVLYRCAEQVSHWISSKSRRLSGRTVFDIDIIGIIGYNHPQRVQRNLWFKSRLILDSLIWYSLSFLFVCFFLFWIHVCFIQKQQSFQSCLLVCASQLTDVPSSLAEFVSDLTVLKAKSRARCTCCTCCIWWNECKQNEQIYIYVYIYMKYYEIIFARYFRLKRNHPWKFQSIRIYRVSPSATDLFSRKWRWRFRLGQNSLNVWESWSKS